MIGKCARAGIAALVLGSSALAVGAVPAQAQVRPGQLPGDREVEIFYYSSAAKTTVVGVESYGNCGFSFSGTSSAYSTVTSYVC
jgi:hypothetical protein